MDVENKQIDDDDELVDEIERQGDNDEDDHPSKSDQENKNEPASEASYSQPIPRVFIVQPDWQRSVIESPEKCKFYKIRDDNNGQIISWMYDANNSMIVVKRKYRI